MTEPKMLRLQLMLKGIRQADIAKRAGVSRSAISQVISGKIGPSEAIRKAFEEVGIEVESANGEE